MMTKKIVSFISVLLLAGGLLAASGVGDVVDNTEPTSSWIEGSRPVETQTTGGSKIMAVDTYWRTSGNSGTTPGTHFLGTTDYKALEIKINNERVYGFYPITTSPNIVGGYHGNSVTSGIYGGTISGGGSYGNVNTVSAFYGTIGGGMHNRAAGNYSTVSGGRSNQATYFYSVIGGGRLNQVAGEASTIGGGYDNEVTGSYSVAGGGYNNRTTSSYATVGGGSSNSAKEMYSTIGGGAYNSTDGKYATVSGGSMNIASGYGSSIAGGTNGDATGSRSFIGGGYDNRSSAYVSVVGGGYRNYADSNYATIGGGYRNEATGTWSTIPGGYCNEASGTRSFAAGSQALARHMGTFVWGDASNSNIELSSTGDNQFIARASGGVWFYTHPENKSGVYLASGSGSWSSVSDKNAKENFSAVDCTEILQKVADLPITTWNYRSQDAEIRHIGPMAQDFYAAFSVGDDDKHLTTVDVDGIALVSIQALYKDNLEKDARIARLEAELATQQDYLEDLEGRLQALEKTQDN